MGTDLLQETPPISLVVAEIRKKNSRERERFLERYYPFILSVASGISGRRITKSDDEASIAAIAFNEAIDTYQEEKGSSFLGFSKLIMRRRLIDYYRSQHTKQRELSYNAPQGGGDDQNYLLDLQQAGAEYARDLASLEYRYEFKQYARRLAEYELSFEDLVLISPRHEDSREGCFQAARLLYKSELLRDYLKRTHRLPVKQLAASLQVHRRTVEKHRKYIIAVFLLYEYKFTSICEYIGLSRENPSPQERGRES